MGAVYYCSVQHVCSFRSGHQLGDRVSITVSGHSARCNGPGPFHKNSASGPKIFWQEAAMRRAFVPSPIFLALGYITLPNFGTVPDSPFSPLPPLFPLFPMNGWGLS